MRKTRINSGVILSLIISIVIINSVSVQKMEGKINDPFFTLVLKTSSYGGIRADYLNFLVQYLERIGIKGDVVVSYWLTSIYELMVFRDFDIACFGLSGTKNSVDPDFTGVYNENGSLNVWGYHTSMDWDEEKGTGLNEWYMKQGTLMTPSNSPERIQHYWDWEEYLMDNVLPLQPLYATKEYDFYWSELEGYNISEGLHKSWGKMSWNGVHDGQISTDEIIITDYYSWSDLNPLTKYDASSAFIIDFIMDSLVSYNSDLSVSPHLAESFEMINDTHVRIKVREGIKWQHDPEELFTNEYLDVKDVYFTLYCWKEISNERNSYLWIKDMEIIDQHTLDIFIDGDPETPQNEPYAPMLSSLNKKILPEHYLNQSQLVDGVTPDKNQNSWSSFSTNGFGTSLFALSDYQEGIETILEIWDDCWWLNSSITSDPNLNWEERFGDFTGGLNQLRIKISDDNEKSRIRFEAGQLDIVDYSSSTIPSDAFLLNPNYEYQSDIKKNMVFFAFNMREKRPDIGSRKPAPGDKSITKGLAIRKAICYAINRAEMNDIIHQGLYKIVDQPIFYKLGIWCNPDIISYDYNLEKAEEYMRIAGYDIGEPSRIFGIRLDLIPIFVISILILTNLKKKKKSRRRTSTITLTFTRDV